VTYKYQRPIPRGLRVTR